MSVTKIFLSAILVSGLLVTPESRAQSASQDSFMKGMNMLPLSDHPYGSRSACEEVRSLKHQYNVDTVVVRKNLILNTYDSPNLIDPKKDGAEDLQIQRQFQTDKRLGVKSFFEVGIRLQSDLDTPGDQNDC